MSTGCDSQAAIKFLRWWFGKECQPYFIGVSYQRDLDASSLDDAPHTDSSDDDLDELQDKRKPKREVTQCSYTSPRKAMMSQWDSHADDSHVYFCTTPLLKNNKRLQANNAAGVPGLWVDIDGLRDLDIPGDEFYMELRDQEAASCWTRSSAQGIQGFFLLDEFFSFSDAPASVLDDDGEEEEDEETRRKAQRRSKNKLFNEQLKPLLLNIAYYYGGDLKVVSPARLMRLPGSVNPKRGDYTCTAQYFDNAWTMAELRKRFKTDEYLVPKVVFYAIVKAMEKVYGPGSHHEPSVQLFGTCRMMGLDEASCERLASDLFKFFKDMKDDPTPSVHSTYDRDPGEDAISNLRSEHEEIADEVERAVAYWIQLKTKYCKGHGIKWKPETNVLGSPAGDYDGVFQFKPDGTYYLNKDDVPEMFANFTVKILYKINKIDGKEVDMAEVTFKNRRYTFEWPSEKDTNFTKFKTITGLPPKLMVLKEDMWKPFVAWLAEQPVDRYMTEMPYYGLLDVEDGKPTLLMPGQDHPDYVWAESEHDTANKAYAFKKVKKAEAIEYLTGFAQHYPLYHEDKFLWCALGWFVACPFSAFARSIYKGFPVLLISGLKESGKTHLIKYVLGAHMGCEDAQTYLGTTLAARRSQLASNNLLPLLVDEFRDTDEQRTTQFTDLIRNLWDQSTRRAKKMDGGAAIDKLIGTLCVVGEHQYEDGATRDRTVSIHVKRTFIESTFTMSEKRKARLNEAREWLESGQRRGVLGSLVLQWMQENFDRVPTMMARASRIIAQNLAGRQLRNAIGFSIVVFGLLVMNEIFKKYDLEFPLDRATMLASIDEADESVTDSEVYGESNLKTLFQVTDSVIIGEIRAGRTLEHFMYEFDIEDEDIAYFDIGRWYDFTHKSMKGSASATLVNKTAFMDLLQVSVKNELSPILGFPEDHPIITKNCVKVDLRIVREQYLVNVQQWSTVVEDYDA